MKLFNPFRHLFLTVMLAVSVTGFAQNKTVQGTVVDSEGVPVIGAGVVVVGNASIGAVTDAKGAYRLSVPARASLEFSCIGYATQVIAVGD